MHVELIVQVLISNVIFELFPLLSHTYVRIVTRVSSRQVAQKSVAPGGCGVRL